MRRFASASIQVGVRSRQDDVLPDSPLSMDALPYEPGDTSECAGSITAEASLSLLGQLQCRCDALPSLPHGAYSICAHGYESALTAVRCCCSAHAVW